MTLKNHVIEALCDFIDESSSLNVTTQPRLMVTDRGIVVVET